MAVVSFDVKSREPFAEGQEFGDVGSYERVDGVLTFAVDPLHTANAVIADLDLAPRDADGFVRFEADVVLVSPAEHGRGNGALILDIPNRGRTVSGYLNGLYDRAHARAGMPIPLQPYDGHTFRRGFSVLSVGWQTDMVPMEHSLAIWPPIAGSTDKPVTGVVWAEIRPNADALVAEISQLGNRGYPPIELTAEDARLYAYEHESAAARLIPRARWRFAELIDGREEPSDRHVLLDGGFKAGHIYRVAYLSVAPAVVGSGLLALRDAVSYFRSSADSSPPGFNRVLGFGVSQTGRVLRHFFNLGMNADEEGRRVLDGALCVIASGFGRGDFNHRFAFPSSLSVRSFGELFPFADRTMLDRHSGMSGGVLARYEGAATSPKVIYLNSAYEYWIGHASLHHTDPATGDDVELHDDVRAYLVAGAQHTVGTLPQSGRMFVGTAPLRYGQNMIAYAPLIRSAFFNLDEWVNDGREPPSSRVPRMRDGSASSRRDALRRYAQLPGVEPPPVANLRVVRQLDLGSESERGVGNFPAAEGSGYPCLVSALDDDLNEIAGIRLPDVTVPVGSHVGWNVLETGEGTSEHVPLLHGMTRFFSRDEAEREALGDPRPSIAARYASRDDYLERVRAETQKLVEDRFLLAEDVDIVVENCAARYDEAIRVGPHTPTD